MLNFCIIKKIKIKHLILMLNFENIKQFKFKKIKKSPLVNHIINPTPISPRSLYGDIQYSQ